MTPAAIILAAGVGKRFGTANESLPKGLLEVGGETLIGRLVRQLRGSGVTEIVLVVGFGGEHIEQRFEDEPGITILHNPDFTRGAILSLYTAREWLERPSIVMDADVFGPDEMIARMVRSRHPSCFLLDPSSAATGEEQMLMVRGDRVIDIARIPRGEYDRLGESVGFLKLDATAGKRLRELLAERVDQGDIDLEHEEVYPALLSRVEVGFELVDDLAWTEIDFPEDLERARRMGAGVD